MDVLESDFTLITTFSQPGKRVMDCHPPRGAEIQRPLARFPKRVNRGFPKGLPERASGARRA